MPLKPLYVYMSMSDAKITVNPSHRGTIKQLMAMFILYLVVLVDVTVVIEVVVGGQVNRRHETLLLS